MYLPSHFIEPRVEELHRIIRENPLGTLVTHSARGLDANHIPFMLDPASGSKGSLQAHVARANPLWTEFAQGADVMVVFRGPDGYISPNWYPSKHETHRQVPTWNYEVVHAHGRLRIVDDAKFLRGLLARLTRHHEASQPKPWKMGDAPADYIDQMLKAIVGVEVEIVRVEGKRKLSQNRDTRDFQGVVKSLHESGNEELSAAMASTGADRVHA
jgi:transcriptional regulator